MTATVARVSRVVAVLTAVGVAAPAGADETGNAKVVRALVETTGEGANAQIVDEVLEVRLGRETTDSHLKTLADLAPPKLWKVNLATAAGPGADGKQGTKFTRAGLKELARLPALRDLRAHSTLTDDDLKVLADCKHLEVLWLTFSKVTDAGLAHLAGAPKLREINLRRFAVTDTGWAALARIAGLQKIGASERMAGKGIEQLAALKGLAELDLSYTGVTDEALAGVAKLATLQRLDLSNTKVTDDGVKQLATLAGLRELRLGGTKCTPAGAEAIKKALPNCRVER